MFLSSVNNNFLMQVRAMKFTESTSIWCISVRLTCTGKLNIKKAFMGNQGFVQIFMWWIGGSHWIIDLLLEKFCILWRKKNSCYSVLTLENHGTYIYKYWCYKVLQSIMTWYINFWLLVMRYANRLVTWL